MRRDVSGFEVPGKGTLPFDSRELLARLGIESGPVVVDAAGEVFGDAPNIAARVQAAAEPGSVLITMNVQRQVAGLFVAEDKGAHELKGVFEPVQLFRVVRASGAGRRSGARTPTPFVGREEELSQLAQRWKSARAGEGQRKGDSSRWGAIRSRWPICYSGVSTGAPL